MPASLRYPRSHIISIVYSMRLLELFSGTGSVGKVFKQHGYEVISLDIDNRATINTDILNWDDHLAHGHL